jgi:putative salt-induced outer membrane protein
MRCKIPSIAVMTLSLAAQAARAAPPPQAVADMIQAAVDDPDTLRAVVKTAKRTNPDSAVEIDRLAKAASADAAVRETAEASNLGFFDGWTGKGELGGSISTGNSDDQGVAAALAFDKVTPQWGHDLNISVDHKREDGKTTKDRYFGAYSIHRNFTPRFYAVGVLWAERDRFAGYNFRTSESLGLGYRLLDRPGLKLRVEGAPALRQSEYLSTGYETTVAARLAGYLTWKPARRLEFGQSLVTYLDSKNPTLLAASSVTTRLEGRFSARASYELRHEEDPPAEREHTDSTTRLTLVFNF